MGIKISKAIEILDLMGTPDFEGHTEDILAARKLGIEALKRIKGWRLGMVLDIHLMLPGETPEEEIEHE